MATKRTPINRRSRRGIRSPEMLAKATRLLELMEAHTLAIVDATDEHMEFYQDGRHEELVDLHPQVCIPLEILPHEDAEAILSELLAKAAP